MHHRIKLLVRPKGTRDPFNRSIQLSIWHDATPVALANAKLAVATLGWDIGQIIHFERYRETGKNQGWEACKP